MQEFHVPLKINECYIKFCFVTVITKSQLSIFSSNNDLTKKLNNVLHINLNLKLNMFLKLIND